ncbi:MAG: hypothetical protein KIT31_18635 [Deltaproteobacteria bacterium]|nr:hypothetical protein [Deltaproteobacteria bacterium]
MQFVLQLLAMFWAPLVATEVTRRLAIRKEARGRRQQLFNTLMVTAGDYGRLGRLSFEHVRALNLIEIEFYGEESVAVLKAWRDYRTVLNLAPPAPWTEENKPQWEAWNTLRDELFVKLLYAMAQSLDYKFDEEFIKNAVYAPMGYFTAEVEGMQIQTQLRELLDGKRALHISAAPPLPGATPPAPPAPTPPIAPGTAAPALEEAAPDAKALPPGETDLKK